MAYVLSCCTTCDMPEEFFARRDIHYICFHFNLNGKDMYDDLGHSISFKDFYQAMRDGASTGTSQVSVGEYEEYFDKFLSQGLDVFHLTLASGISGTLQSAMVAQKTMQEKYPDRKIVVMDSLCAAAGYGLLMDHLADLRDAGKSFDEVVAWAEEHRLNIHTWFFTEDLTYLIRGGRVSKAAGAIGSLLKLCPLMNVDYKGKLVSRAKIRTKKKCMRAAVDTMEQHADGGVNYSGKVFIGHADCLDDAQELAAMVAERFPKSQQPYMINYIGTTIGSHTGPGLLVLDFDGDKRVD